MTAYEDTVSGSVTDTPSIGGAISTLIDTVAPATTTSTPSITGQIQATVTPSTVTCTPSLAGATSALVDSVTETVICTPVIPHVYIFVNLDNFALENWSVSKNINDALWHFSAEIDKHTIPSFFKNLVISMVGLDRASPPNEINYTVFLGLVPGAKYVFEPAKNRAQISGFDHGWYLAAQAIPSTQTITDEDVNPTTLLKSLLGDGDSLKITGLDLILGNIIDVVDWTSIKKPFKWKFDTKKQKAISEIVDYTGSIFHIKPKLLSGGYYPAAYFVADIDHATEGLDLPDIATFTNPDSYLRSVQKEINEGDTVNRVTVHGTNRTDGTWKTTTVESADVTAGDTIPRELVIAEYVPEPPPADAAALQTAVDARATLLYDLFYTNATTTLINATFKRRADLELWQKVGFVGYDDIPAYSAPSTNVMRIVQISYSRRADEDLVSIQCIPDKDLSNDQARRIALGKDYVSGEQDIMSDMIHSMGDTEIGQVIAITDSVATVTLEKDGKSVEARILNP